MRRLECLPVAPALPAVCRKPEDGDMSIPRDCMMKLSSSLIIAAALALTMSGCNNQDPDQPAVGSISIKARPGAINERAKAPQLAKKARGERRT